MLRFAPAPRPDERTRLSWSLIKSPAWLRLSLYASLAALDAAMLLLAAEIVVLARFDSFFEERIPTILALLIPVYVWLAFQMQAYGLDSLRKPRRAAWIAGRALLSTFGFAVLVAFALKVSAEYSRIGVALFAVAACVTLMAGRIAFQYLIMRKLKMPLTREVILCDGVMLLPHGHETVINATALGISPRQDDPHMLDKIGRALEHADRLVIACAPENRRAWSDALQGLGIDIEVLVPEAEEVGVIGTRRFHGRLTGVVAHGPMRTRDRLAKRLFDLAVVMALLPGLFIVTAIVAILIKLEDRGPVFFLQMRVGRGNRLFPIYKFRSMRQADSDLTGAQSTGRSDPRITRIGAILRKTSIDELPQLFNVLKGDMSLVGPRPHAIASRAGDALFWEVESRYFHRHAVKPGLTGLAQIRGFRGATDTVDALTNRVSADLEYLVGWSLRRDISILFATLRVVMHPNAY